MGLSFTVGHHCPSKFSLRVVNFCALVKVSCATTKLGSSVQNGFACAKIPVEGPFPEMWICAK